MEHNQRFEEGGIKYGVLNAELDLIIRMATVLFKMSRRDVVELEDWDMFERAKKRGYWIVEDENDFNKSYWKNEDQYMAYKMRENEYIGCYPHLLAELEVISTNFYEK